MLCPFLSVCPILSIRLYRGEGGRGHLEESSAAGDEECVACEDRFRSFLFKEITH